MRKIMVEPLKLESTASKISSNINEYQSIYNKLFQEVDLMSSSWQGEDNIAFTSQIRGYEEDFKKIQILCEQYSDFLRNSARAYRNMQEELVNQAKQLIN